MVLGRLTDRGGSCALHQVFRDLLRLRVGVVAADRVQDRDAVLHQLLRRDLARGFSPSMKPFFTQSATFVRARELPIGRAATPAVSECTASVTLTCSPAAQALVAALVADDLDRRIERRVLLDEEADRRRRAGTARWPWP